MFAPAANIRPIRAISDTMYSHPSLDELIQLCRDYGLIREIMSHEGLFHIACKDEVFAVSPSEAETLVRGLLIGYFAFHTRDDLSLANWIE